MVAAMLRDEPNLRWADVLDSLKKADLQEIQIQFPDYAFSSLVAAIEVSVKQLPKEIQRCYLDLAVFPGDTPVVEPWKQPKTGQGRQLGCSARLLRNSRVRQE